MKGQILDTTGITMPGTPGGLQEAVIDLYGLATTPYAATAVYDPFATGEPLETYIADMDGFFNAFLTYDTSAATDYNDLITEVSASWDSIFGTVEIDNAVDYFAEKEKDRTLTQIGEINAIFSDLESVNSSARILAVIDAYEKHLTDVKVFRGDLEVKAYLQRNEIKAQAAISLNTYKAQVRDSYSRLIQLGIAARQLHIEAARLKYSDDLNNLLEDTLWDAKSYDYFTRGLGALSGAGIVPAGASPLSTFASAAGALSPLLIPLFGKLF